MEGIDRDFNQTENKFSLISKPMNCDYISSLNDDNAIDYDRLYSVKTEDVLQSIPQRTHALALAICAADVVRVEKFLEVVENPNDISLLVGGFRQPYNMIHLALDPVWPKRIDGDINSRLQIIDLLAAKGFDVNFIPGPTTFKNLYNLETRAHFYWNPPLAGYTVHGIYEPKDVKELPTLQARLLLRGADPALVGSSYSPIIPCMPIENAFEQVIRENLDNLKPVETVKAELIKLKDSKLLSISNELNTIVSLPQQNAEALLKISNELGHIARIQF